MRAKNFLILSVDGLQAGMLGPYGNAWIRTPAINQLASQSVVFDQAYARRPSLDAVFHAMWQVDGLGSRRATLLTDDPIAERHPASSYFADKRFLESLQEHLTAVSIEDTEIGVLLAQASEFLSQATEPFCLWIHSRGMSGTWDAPYELREQYADEEDPAPPDFAVPPARLLSRDYDPDEVLGIQQAYAGQVSALDTCLGALIAAMNDLPAAKDTLFVLLGTRGYPLGEHLHVGPDDCPPYNELTHVPLIVRYPSGAFKLERNQAFVSHADLAAILRGDLLPARDHLIFELGNDRAIRTPAWYLIERGWQTDPQRELYVKPDDRYEVNNVADRCPDIVSELANILASPADAISQPLPEPLTTTLD